MQVGKYLANVKTPDGTDLIFDLMQVEAYWLTDKDIYGAPTKMPCVQFRMQSGVMHVIQSDAHFMQMAMSNAGIPFYSL